MGKKIVTLYLDDSGLRLLVVQNGKLKKWAEAPLDPGLIKGNVVTDEEAVAARVRQLFKTQRVSKRKVIVGLSGLHCLTRPMTLPALPRAMLDEAVVREARRALPVPLEQLHISWQTIPAPEGKSQVFLVAVPLKTAESFIGMLRKAGVKPYILGLKPLALASVVKESTSIIIDVQPTEFDIVVMAYGIPQPIRTVPFPTEEMAQKEKWTKVKEELDRTIKFYNSNNPDKILGSDVPIFVSGELANRPRLNKALSDEFGFNVVTLTSPMCTSEVDSTRYMVNIGLALKEPGASKEPGPSMVNVNALPVEFRAKPIPLLKVIALPSAVAFIGITILLTTVVQDAAAKVASLHSQLDNTNTLITQKQDKKKELTASITALEKKASATAATRTMFDNALIGLDQNHERITGDLRLTTDRFPPESTLAVINQTPGRFAIQGTATDENEVLDYARILEASGRFKEVTVSAISRLDEGGVAFTLSLAAKEKK